MQADQIPAAESNALRWLGKENGKPNWLELMI